MDVCYFGAFLTAAIGLVFFAGGVARLDTRLVVFSVCLVALGLMGLQVFLTQGPDPIERRFGL
jgi:hypothetical protein